LDTLTLFNISPTEGGGHLGFLHFDENAQECQSGTHQIWIQHPKIY